MTLIQVLLAAFAVFALSRVVARFRQGSVAAIQLAFWTVIWAGILLVVVLPETTSAVARVLGVGRGADVAVYLAIVAVFYLLFRVFTRLDAIERQITRLVRRDALKDLEDDGHER